MINKYLEYIVNTKPTKLWVNTRFILHWITLPIKLTLIAGLGLFGIIYNKVKYKTRNPQSKNLNLAQKVQRLQKILKFLPVLKNDNYDLYLPRNKFGDARDGSSHSPDHQLLRQGQYVFLMSKLKKRTPQMEQALCNFMVGEYLARGYTWDFQNFKFKYNLKSTSGDMLIGLCLAMLDTSLLNENQSMLMEKFDQLISNIIEYDYSLLEGQEPTDEPYKSIWNKRLKLNDMREEKVKMKSSRAMWQPGLEVTGAQSLTLLAALKVNAKKNRSLSSDKEYWNMFYKHGYALLSLFPTAYLPNRRGYFNDVNCIQALYVLLKLSNTKVEKAIYKFALKYVFNLSKSWYNLYVIGLIKEVAPEILDREYLEQANKYRYEEDPILYSISSDKKVQSFETPVPLSYLHHSEFAYGDKLDQLAVSSPQLMKYSTGLSELAVMVLLEEGINEVLNNPKSFN